MGNINNSHDADWRMVIKIIIAIATALLGAIGVQEAGGEQ